MLKMWSLNILLSHPKIPYDTQLKLQGARNSEPVALITYCSELLPGREWVSQKSLARVVLAIGSYF